MKWNEFYKTIGPGPDKSKDLLNSSQFYILSLGTQHQILFPLEDGSIHLAHGTNQPDVVMVWETTSQAENSF